MFARILKAPRGTPLYRYVGSIVKVIPHTEGKGYRIDCKEWIGIPEGWCEEIPEEYVRNCLHCGRNYDKRDTDRILYCPSCCGFNLLI